MVGHSRNNSASHNISFSSSVIGEYIIGQTLGEGSCAIVKLATHQTTGQKVAVKIIKPNSLQEQKEVLREVESLQILKQGNHPYIIKLVQLIKEGGYTCLILELAEGGELFNYIVDSGRLKESEARRLFRQIVSGVLYSHAHLIVHRDLKPENLILDSQRNIKVTDFGLSNILKPGMLFSTFCGSPVYTSPEVVLHKQYNGTIADVWSLGAVLYVMVTGGMPWRLEKNAVKNMDQLLVANFRLPDSLGLSAEVKDLIRIMLTADAKERATLETVARHPWMCIGYDGPPSIHLKAKPLVPADRINENVLEHLILLGMDITRARHDITQDPFCPALTAYHNLMEKHQRACRVVSDYNTVSTAQVTDNADLSPSRTRAKSAPSNDKANMPNAPVLNKILALRGSDPLVSRIRSSTHYAQQEGHPGLLTQSADQLLPPSEGGLEWDYKRYTDSPSQTPQEFSHVSSVRVPRRSVELRDLFSAPSMPSTDTMTQLRMDDLLPNIPSQQQETSPFFNPFSDAAQQKPSSRTSADMLPLVLDLAPNLNFGSSAGMPAPTYSSGNPFSNEGFSSAGPTQTHLLPHSDVQQPTTPLTPVQQALLFPSRTDSPTNALSSPYIPPVTVIQPQRRSSMVGREDSGRRSASPIRFDLAPGLVPPPSTTPVCTAPASTYQSPALVLNSNLYTNALSSSPDTSSRGLTSSHVIVRSGQYDMASSPHSSAPPMLSSSSSHRKSGAFRSFMDIFRRSSKHSPSQMTNSSYAQGTASLCGAPSTPTKSPTSPKLTKRGSALKFNTSPTSSRRAIFSKN